MPTRAGHFVEAIVVEPPVRPVFGRPERPRLRVVRSDE